MWRKAALIGDLLYGNVVIGAREQRGVALDGIGKRDVGACFSVYSPLAPLAAPLQIGEPGVRLAGGALVG